MESHRKVKLLIIAVNISLILSLVFTITAIADDATPPPATEEPVSPPKSNSTSPSATGEPISPSSEATEEPASSPKVDSTSPSATGEPILPSSPATEEPASPPKVDSTSPSATGEPISPSSAATGEPALPLGNQPTVADALSKLPNGTNIVVTANNQIQPLATQAAANAFVVGDPIWCPDGVSPVAGSGVGSGGCTDSYTNLFLLIDDISSGNLTLPAVNGTIWIQGNDNSSPDVTIDGSDPNFFALSAKSLTLQGAWTGSSVIGSNVSGTSIFSVPISIVNWGGTVTINNITVDGSNVAGSPGLDVQTSADVSLNDVSVNNNNNIGLSVDAGSDITINNLTAEGNGVGGGVDSHGAELNSTSGGVTLTGTNTFNNNQHGTGLVIDANGDIELENMTANNNVAGSSLTTSAGGLSITGTNNEFNNNDETGLSVDVTGGDVELENIDASGNGVGGVFGDGANINTSGSVSITGTNNTFSNNQHGIGISTDAGNSIDLENVTANDNVAGADLTTTSGGVSITGGTNAFNNNDGTGLLIDSNGHDLDLENIDASGNGAGGVFGNGADITSGNLSLTGTNTFSENHHGTGLVVDSSGGVDLENVTASKNVAGADLTLSGGLSITGTNVFSENDGTGLNVDAGGNIYAENLTVEKNGLVNGSGDGADFITLGSFTLSGTKNVFNGNFADGLYVSADGDISIENVTAKFNGNNGITLETKGKTGITCGVLTNNPGYAVEADITDTITLTGVDFGGSVDDDLGLDDGYLSLVSNGCFTYPPEGGDEGDDGEDQPVYDFGDVLLINKLSVVDGQIVGLNCSLYEGTLLTLTNGDGAYVPCDIVDSARLTGLSETALPKKLPDGAAMVSSFSLVITKNGQMLKPPKDSDSIWFAGPSNTKSVDSKIYYWDGFDWIELTDTYPFMSVFFSVPEAMKNADLAIYYWNGTDWIQLSAGQHFDNGGMVQEGGHINKDGLFEARVNFVGIFALGRK